jgi:hypothetical protein
LLDIDVHSGGVGSFVRAVGNLLGDALVWPGRVVMDVVFNQDGAQVVRRYSKSGCP